jgi:hypothetical protein
MARKTTTSSRKKAAEAPSLGPGLHGATVELASGDKLRVRTATGVRLHVTLSDHVERELVEECLRTGRRVVLEETERGPAIVGALQTTRAVALAPDGTLDLRARELRLRSEGPLVIESGSTALRVDETGALRLEGDRMVIDMSSLVRFLAARVELP